MKIQKISRTVLILAILITSSCSKKSDPEIPTPIVHEKIFNSDLLNPTNYELQVFHDSGYNVINGDLGFLIIDTLIDLTKLSNLISVKGDVYFNAISRLETLEGLNNLQSVGGDLIFTYDPKLLNFNALSKLKNIGGKLGIHHLDLLENLNGLNNLDSISDGMQINNNDKLSNFDGLKELTIIKGRVTIFENYSILSFNGFENIKSVGSLNIWGNINLKTLEGLNNLESCAYGINLVRNENLSDFCALKNIKDLNEQGYYFFTSGNKYNPSLEDILTGNCSYDN